MVPEPAQTGQCRPTLRQPSLGEMSYLTLLARYLSEKDRSRFLLTAPRCACRAHSDHPLRLLRQSKNRCRFWSSAIMAS